MFDIGGLELLIIAVVALMVIGPERLPETLRTLGLWMGRLRRSFTSVKAEIEKEIGMDDVRRQLHNEHVMEEMKRIEREVKNTVDEVKIDPNLDNNSKMPSSAKSNEHSEPAEAASSSDTSTDTSPDTAPEPSAPRPRSEAEVEAAFEHKQQSQKTGSEPS